MCAHVHRVRCIMYVCLSGVCVHGCACAIFVCVSVCVVCVPMCEPVIEHRCGVSATLLSCHTHTRDSAQGFSEVGPHSGRAPRAHVLSALSLGALRRLFLTQSRGLSPTCCRLRDPQPAWAHMGEETAQLSLDPAFGQSLPGGLSWAEPCTHGVTALGAPGARLAVHHPKCQVPRTACWGPPATFGLPAQSYCSSDQVPTRVGAQGGDGVLSLKTPTGHSQGTSRRD